MNILKLLLLSICLLMFVSCAPLKRGMDGNTYISSSQPAFSVSVTELPLRTSGRFNASITTSKSLGGVSVDTWMAVYGGTDVEQAMAIVAHSNLDNPFYWDSNLRKVHSINHSNAYFGKFTFQACTYLLKDLKKDAFSPLTFDMAVFENEEEPKTFWLVRRFATRMDFNRGKITLEYREKAPDNFIDIKSLPLGAQSFIEGFEERAQKAFTFGTGLEHAQNIQTDYPSDVRIRYLNTNFFGTISYHDPFD